MSATHRMWIAALGSFALLAGAYAFQAMGYAPCKMCLWQRWPHVVAIVAGIVAVLWSNRFVALTGAIAMLTTAAIGVYHSGVERGWWEGPTSCSGGQSLGGLSGADLLSTDVMDRIVMCDEIAWSFAGLSMASWNAVFSVLLAAIWLSAFRRLQRSA